MKYYNLGDRVPNVYGRDQLNYMAKRTGEYRSPKAGEWYLSGAIPLAYRAPNDLRNDYNICKVVKVEKITTIREVS